MIERIPIDEWLAFDREHPAPTFFARPAWALALAEANPSMTAAPLRVRVGAEDIIVPLMALSGGTMRWREYWGFPLGGYTCLLRDDGSLADESQTRAVLAQLHRHAHKVTVIPWPLGPSSQSGNGPEHTTDVVDLADGLDAALSRVAGIFRRMAGQAERRGVVCAPRSTAAAVDDYYSLLEISARRWGLERPTIRKEFLRALVAHGGGDVEIWFARAEERDIGGGVVFYGAQELFFWSAAMDAEYGRLRPSNALNFALLRAAAARGMLYYNLGSSEGLPGVARFKDNLGTREVSYREHELTRAPYEVYEHLRRALRTRVGA